MEKSKYKSLDEWRQAKRTMYNEAKQRGLLNNICNIFGWNLPQIKRPYGYWTLERCKEDALQYKTRNEWYKNSGSAYGTAVAKDWLNECCEHMKDLRPLSKTFKKRGYWTLERCKEDALQYKTRNEWCVKSNSAYGTAAAKCWLSECCEHMINALTPLMKISKPSGYWTLEKCKEDALQYQTRNEWRKNSGSAYGRACTNNWLENCCKHMKNKNHGKRNITI